MALLQQQPLSDQQRLQLQRYFSAVAVFPEQAMTARIAEQSLAQDNPAMQRFCAYWQLRFERQPDSPLLAEQFLQAYLQARRELAGAVDADATSIVSGTTVTAAHNILDFVSRHHAGSEQWVVHLSVEGACLLSSSGQQQLLGAGQLVFIGPDHDCDYQRSPAAPRWVHHWVRATLPTDWLHWCPALQQPQNLLVLDMDESTQPLAEQVFTDLLQLSTLNNAQDLLFNRLAFLFRLLARQQVSEQLSDRERLDPRIQQAVQFISKHYTDNWRVEAVAKHCHLSTARLATLFKQQLGVSPMQWRDQLRMRQARQQLQQGHSPIAEIAQQLGYPDALHFSRRFKQTVGLSPRQYRQQRKR